MTDKRAKRQVDLSPVDPEDRPYVKKILSRIINFHSPPPDMDIQIQPHSDHYNVAFIGWDQSINDIEWYKTFLNTNGPEKRENVFDMIMDSETVPMADAEDNDVITGPIKLVRLKRSGFHSSRKRRK